MIIYCPKCDTGCSRSATTCPACGHLLNPSDASQTTDNSKGLDDFDQYLDQLRGDPVGDAEKEFRLDEIQKLGRNMPVHKMKGVAEVIEVFDDKVEITPKGVTGFILKGLKGTKSILFTSITAIQFKAAGITSGYLQFTIPGGNESRGGVFAAASDENTFMFAGKQQNATAIAIKEFIESRIRELRAPQAVASAPSLSDELEKLAGLRKQGILTEQEFESAKKRLID